MKVSVRYTPMTFEVFPYLMIDILTSGVFLHIKLGWLVWEVSLRFTRKRLRVVRKRWRKNLDD